MIGPAELRLARAALIADRSLTAADLRAELCAQVDRWVVALFTEAVAGPIRADADAGSHPDAPRITGLSLVAVGGYGRCELAPFSDLDLVLLYEPTGFGVDGAPVGGRGSASDRVAEVADRIWYPVWDTNIGLDHAVRTPGEVDTIVRTDLRAQLGLIDLRHLAGDAGLSARTRAGVLDRWGAGAPTRVSELAADARARWALAGDAAFLLEPDVKASRGALRDIGLLRALALAQLIDLSPEVRSANRTLLDVRTELQRRADSRSDILRLQEQAGVALALGLPDADAVLLAVNEAARGVAHVVDDAFRRVAAPKLRTGSGLGGLRRLIGRGGPALVTRLPVARDVVEQEGEVVLARDADPWADPVLVLRAARAAAERDLPLSPFTLQRLATESGPMPVPWPPSALTELVTLLGTGRSAISVIESLDLGGLFGRLFPEWDAVRFKAQHNPVHRFTVDRHLLETAAEAAALQQRVDRPDLLLIGALLHDIGKGYVGDHSTVGAAMVPGIATRMGLPPADIEILVLMVRHHLLLPDTATRRDLSDPMTIDIVARAVGGSRLVLELLHSLSFADAAATGPAAWSRWKGDLVASLARRAAAVLEGAPLPAPELPSPRIEALAALGAAAVEVTGALDDAGAEVLVVAPNVAGVLSRTAGVLALHSLDVRSATIHTGRGMAINTFVATSRFGSTPDVTVMRGDLERAMAGTLALDERLKVKERSYALGSSPEPTAAHRNPTVTWLDDASRDATVLEIRTDDAIGLLYRLTGALEQEGLEIRSARVSSLGRAVVDAFYVTTAAGDKIPAAARPAIDAAVQRATAASV